MISVIDTGEQKTFKPTPIAALNLSNRAHNALTRGGIDFVEQLVWLDRTDILRKRNMGLQSFNEINDKVKALGLRGWD
jgi:DNA-directed RNA polymerase alpha subunit